MQQSNRQSNRLDSRKQWLQLGLLSASVLAPLLARWNELRGAERAGDMLEDVEARLKMIGDLAPSAYREVRQQLADVARETGGKIMAARGKGSSKLWLVGAGVGLAAAGAGTYVLVRRRLGTNAAEEPLYDLPITSSSGIRRNGAHSANPGRDDADQRALDQEDLPVIVEPTPWDGGGATVTPDGAPAGVVIATEAPFIGDIKTMIYHQSDGDNLPAEQNRIYFASEDEAHDAGFRRDRDEVAASGMETQAQD
ncbi:MAG: hypothetical protein ACHQ4H_09450 [Ktedonobacterales bacterium]